MPALLAMSSTESSSRVRVASISTPRPMSCAAVPGRMSRVRLPAVDAPPPWTSIALLTVSQLAIDSRFNETGT